MCGTILVENLSGRSYKLCELEDSKLVQSLVQSFSYKLSTRHLREVKFREVLSLLY